MRRRPVELVLAKVASKKRGCRGVARFVSQRDSSWRSSTLIFPGRCIAIPLV